MCRDRSFRRWHELFVRKVSCCLRLTRARNWSLRVARGIRPTSSKPASSEKRFRSFVWCFAGNCEPGRESPAWSRKSKANRIEDKLPVNESNCEGQCLQSSGSIRILKSGHENSARAVQSHRWRLRRECRSHPELGWASQTARRGPCCFYRALPLRLSSPGSFGAPGFSRPEHRRTERACGQNSSAEPRGLRGTCEERRGQIRGQQSGAAVRRASRL